MNEPEGSLIDQRERLMRLILTPERYAKRIEFMDSIKPVNKLVTEKQLRLFEF